MPYLRQLLYAALTTGLFLTSGTAEARFGKRSSDDDKSESKVHDATAVGQSSSSGSSSGSSGSSSGSSGDGLVSFISFLIDVAQVASSVEVTTYEPPPEPSTYTTTDEPPAYQPPPPVEVEQQMTVRQEEVAEQRQYQNPRPRNVVLFRTGVEGQSFGDSDGTSVSLLVGLEGLHWGGVGAVTSMKLPTDDGTQGTDEIELYAAHLTYALLTSDEGRLRVEAGVAGAKAPDLRMVGPSVAVSFERCVVGAVDVEGRAQLVPVPYLAMDAQAGLALHLSILTLRGGWRWMMLNDRGLAGGEAHQDLFNGPYVGLGLNI